ncbi:AbiJ-NTD4 domain-containing protein [uncultured Bacteroides sp.]|uniref:AbiJ-NTD4 domain-containing protein n=1 Tax=uncultured Bacteroides sp. TaxID=162156 RepID=UPI002AA7D775|nr:hypothetical protein [uncultured Bacteroides sp.]
MKDTIQNFSERNGYVVPKVMLVKEKLTPDIIIAISNTIELLKKRDNILYFRMEENMWYKVFNRKIIDFGSPTKGYNFVSIEYIENPQHLWYEKLDYIEILLRFVKKANIIVYTWFVDQLNTEFESHYFAYRIIDGKVTEINPEEENRKKEIKLYETTNTKNVRTYMRTLFDFLFF